MCMRTNIILNDDLINEALQYADTKTKTGLIHQALKEFIALHKRKNLNDLFGKINIDPDYDYKSLRS